MITFIEHEESPVGTSFETDWTELSDWQTLFYQVVFTGSDVTGTLTIEGSADMESVQTVAGSQFDVTLSGVWDYDIIGNAARYIRLKWVYISGTGNITVVINS